MKIEIIKGDITKIKIDAIVNAANTSLLGGGGVDGAIHKAGGKVILEDCRKIRNRQGGCKTGEAVITTAGNLDAKYVIHTVGPVWNNGSNKEEVLLKNCYKNTLELAEKKQIKTIAFPNISTGIYKFPKQLAAKIAIDTVKKYAKVETVIFVCFDEENYTIYKELVNGIIENMFIGFSLADALGVPVEFKTRTELKNNPVNDMMSFGTYNQPAGTWSDDSSLSFCLADSLCNGYDLKDMAQKFVAWKNAEIWTPYGRVFDIGNQTRSAIFLLNDILEKQDYKSLELLKYNDDEFTNGNGSLMRILPLLFYIKGKSVKEQFKIIWEVSALTHPHIRSALACLIYLKFAEFISNGLSLIKAYNEMKIVINSFFKENNFAKKEVQLFDRLLKNNIQELKEEEIQSEGYVIYTLEASFWCLLTTDSYLNAVFKAINLGEDTDTTACVVGGISGMFYGLEEVPKGWIAKLARLDDIKELSHKFSKKNRK